MNGSHTSWKSVFYLPKHTSTQVDIMLHESHPAIFRPASSVVIANHVLVVWVGILSQVSLNELSCLIRCKFEQYIKVIDISQVNPDRVSGL